MHNQKHGDVYISDIPMRSVSHVKKTVRIIFVPTDMIQVLKSKRNRGSGNENT